MFIDIRDRPSIGHDDVLDLNFINSSAPCVFRKHFRQGLRSHIMEILDPLDIETERNGAIAADGMRWFPKARPQRMLRIFRSRLRTLDNALKEIGRVKTVERYLAPNFMATSQECIVDYQGPEGRDLLLCGFQEYVAGSIVDPWTILDRSDLLPALYDGAAGPADGDAPPMNRWVRTVRQNAREFVARIKRMIVEAATIPDLAGAGNLIVTASGETRLVDINNISPVDFEGAIFLDEKGYPVCDKSIEALSLIEEKVAGQPIDKYNGLYKRFFDPVRWAAVKAREREFWNRIQNIA
ncbi:hypothetical protein [uncultured Desulfosarcina sp.]|uniref:hypothetical protein n=1 Tax=uncultured Desulfosarcina sp. TaxID=218289 RepID=UPI0029C65BCF|nr:hypothetical protein [uncultured Desulfosarcina sp.]